MNEPSQSQETNYAGVDQPAPSPNSCGVVDEILRLLRECRESQVEAIKHLEKIKPWRPTP